MSRTNKFNNPDGIYFITFSTIHWLDVFTRREYKDLLVDSLNYCIKNKGLVVYSWVIMTNHVHLLASSDGNRMCDIMRDLKRYTSNSLTKLIKENPQESRQKWMMSFFENLGKNNYNNENYQFWQQYNQPKEVSSMSLDRAIKYIHENPVKAGFVDYPEYYAYSSAVDYFGGKGRVIVQLV